MNARTESFAPGMDAEVAMLRIPPHSAEAESSVLGALLLDNSAWDRVGDLLTDSDFYRSEHRLIFAAVGALANANKQVDVITVFNQLQGVGKADEVGGLAYLGAIAQYVPSAANIRRYAEIVRERSILRKLVSASDEIGTMAFNPQGKNVEKVLDEAGAMLTAVFESGSSDGDWVSMDALMVQQLDDIQTRADSDNKPDHYIPTGLAALDDMLDGGMRGGQLIILGARPSMGKSALADTIGLHVAREQGLPVGKFSMEMQNAEGGQRALAAVGRVPLHALRRPERLTELQWSGITQGVEKLRNVPFYSYDKGGLNINQVRARARALRRRHGLRLLVIDYVQLMSGTDTRAPRTYQLEEVSRGLKALAKELDIPILCLAQVNRGVEKEVDPMPKMSDLKDCGSFEQDADIIIFMHRPWVVKKGLSDEWKFFAQCHLAKQRGGRTGEFHLQYIGEHTLFTDWPEDIPIPANLTIEKGRKAL